MNMYMYIYERQNRIMDPTGTSLAGPAGTSWRNTAIRFAVADSHIMDT